MDRPLDPASARALLDWMVEMGADEAIGEVALDRFALADPPAERPAAERPTPRPAARPAAVAPGPVAPPDLVRAAEEAAAAAGDLAALAIAMEAWPCDLKRGARRFVLSDGTPGAPLMIVGEAPGREEDAQGRPFVGPAGQLLDRMLAAIGRSRADPDPARSVYITNVLPWRPPGNRRPEPAEIDRWRPFLRRHVDLAAPRVLLIAGNTPALALLGRGGITQLRGRWHDAGGRPAMPTFHPSYILRIPDAEALRKREARQRVWDDLQMVRDRLQET